MTTLINTRNGLGGPEDGPVGENVCYTNLTTPGTLIEAEGEK